MLHNNKKGLFEFRLIRNKKGISEIVSYVLLILLVLAIAALVFAWVKTAIPKDKAECPDVSIRIQDYNCSNNVLSIEIKNNGLFNIDGWYARGYDKKGVVGILEDDGKIKSEERLNVSSSITKAYNYNGEIASVEIEPFVYDGEEILCSEDIVKQDIEC